MAQVVDFGKFATKQELDSVAKLIGKPPVIVPPIVKLPDCNCGLKLVSLLETKASSVKFNFYGCGDIADLYYYVIQGPDTLRKGNIAPVNDKPTVSFTDLPQGDYKFAIRGKSCTSVISDAKVFTIPKLTGEVSPPVIVVPPVEQTGKVYELLLNLTGEGFEATYFDQKTKKLVDNPTGLKGSEYIDKFRLPDGSYPFTGTRIALQWFEFEKTPGVYEVEGFKRMIQWHKERGLSLSICFLPWRRHGDGFFGEDAYMKGDKGGYFFPVSIDSPLEPYKYNQTIASYAHDQTNARIKKVVQVISELLSTYDKAIYVCLGSGRGEEFVMPNFDTMSNNVKISGQLTDFSDVYQAKFKAWVEKRNLTSYGKPTIDIDPPYLHMDSEIGKEFARFATYTMRKYFDNFAEGVRAGSSKIAVGYLMPSIGTHQNGYELGAYIAYIAKNSDIIYHSDGAFPWDNQRKPNGIRVLRGTFPDKIAAAEVDSEDSGERPGWGDGEFNGDQFASIAEKIWGAGGQITHIAMHLRDSAIPKVRAQTDRLRAYAGKPFNPPPITVLNTKIVDITKDPTDVFKNATLYDDTFSARPDVYIEQTASNYWGGIEP